MKKVIICLFSLVFMAACVDDLDEYNIDTKRATDVPPATLFTKIIGLIIGKVIFQKVSQEVAPSI